MAQVQASIRKYWFERKSALERGDPVAAQRTIEELRAYMAQEGITADKTVARGFAYEGYENLREGNYERAREAFDLARSFDPYLPQAQLGYAWGLLRAGRGFVASVTEYRKGVALLWAQFITDEIRLSNLAVIVALAVVASLLVTSLVVVLRCQGRARHDLFETARRFLPERGARFASWTILLLPLLVWLGGLWLILFWLVTSFRYMRIPEKIVTACVFLMVGLSPLALSIVLDRFEASSDPEVRVAVAAMQEGYSPETVRKLRNVVSAHPENAELHLLLGNCYLKGGILGEALDEYKNVLSHNPTSVAGMVNLGNIYYRLGEVGQAANMYKQALQSQPDLVSAYWNLYVAQTDLLHFTEAEQSLAKARSLDGSMTTGLLALKKDGGNSLVEEKADLSQIKHDLRAGKGDGAFDLANPLSLAGGLGLILALVLGAGKQPMLAVACSRCGRAYCSRCQFGRGKAGYCDRCVHLFIKRDGVTHGTRTEGIAKLERRLMLKMLGQRVLSFVLPGSAHLLTGRFAVGLPLVMGWISAIIFLVTRDRLLLTTNVPVTDLPPPGIILVFILMFTTWVIGNTVKAQKPLQRRVQTSGA